jgi:hypothetical protein
MKIILATAKAPHNRRVEFAMRTWVGAEIREIECRRTSAELGDARECYFFKDVYDESLNLEPDQLFCYLNNDVALVPEWQEILIPAVQSFGSAASSRVEVPKFEEQLKLNQIRGGCSHGGKDVFAFFPAWWQQVRNSLPDLLLGYAGYDFVVFKTMLETGGKEVEPICFHETHIPFWRTVPPDHPVYIKERELCEKWGTEKEGRRFDYSPYGIASIPRPRNLSTSATNNQKNLSTSAELFT